MKNEDYRRLKKLLRLNHSIQNIVIFDQANIRLLRTHILQLANRYRCLREPPVVPSDLPLVVLHDVLLQSREASAGECGFVGEFLSGQLNVIVGSYNELSLPG